MTKAERLAEIRATMLKREQQLKLTLEEHRELHTYLKGLQQYEALFAEIPLMVLIDLFITEIGFGRKAITCEDVDLIHDRFPEIVGAIIKCVKHHVETEHPDVDIADALRRLH